LNGGVAMADYQMMYTVLFQKITDVIEELQNIQRETEEMCISSESADIENMDAEKSDTE
jgi:pantothenate kinase